MADRIYRLNLYTPADFEAQIRTFETMARKGWQLEYHSRHLLRYRKSEPSETRYAMIFLREKPIKGIESATKHRTIDRALDHGWTLVCDDPLMNLQIFRTEQVNPAPIEENTSIVLKQTALFLQKQHLRQRIFFLLLPLFVFILFANDGLSPLRMVALPAFFWPYTLLGIGLLYSLLEGLWYLLWRYAHIPACTIPRMVLRLFFSILYCVTLWAVCTAGLRMIAFMMLALTITVLAVLSYRLLKRKFYENRALAAPMFILLITMLALFMADVVINLHIENETLLTLSDQTAPVTFSELGYEVPAEGPYESHSPAADYMIYGRIDAESNTYLYYEICTIPFKPIRDLVVRVAAWDYWMDPTTPDDSWNADAAYAPKPSTFNAYCMMVCKEDTLYFIYGWPTTSPVRLLEMLTQ